MKKSILFDMIDFWVGHLLKSGSIVLLNIKYSILDRQWGKNLFSYYLLKV